MKIILFCLVALGMIMATVYFVFGSPAMVVALAFLVAITLAVICLVIGSLWSAKLMERGANIALQSQVSGDRLGEALVRAITGSVANLLKLRDQAAEEARSQYPALPFYSESEPDGDFAAAGFTIEGFEKE